MPNDLTLPFSGTATAAGTPVGTGFNAFSVTISPSLNTTDTAIFGICSGGRGVLGSAQGPSGVGVVGLNGNDPLFFLQTGGHGNIGVAGFSDSGAGVYGRSNGFDAAVGETGSDAHAGVTGRNLTTGANGGVGIYGVGGKFAGKFDGALQVNGPAEVTGNFSLKGSGDVGGNLGVLHTLSVSGTAEFAGDFSFQGSGNVGGNLTVLHTLGCPGTCDFVTVNVSGDVILTNQDCAEDFDIHFGLDVEPGTVMVLDEGGLLQESRHAYDKKVAGVISGAGEFKPGLILGRDKGHRDGHRAPVALVGKVYCKVDAQHTPIEIGDLLTTSATAGHAMKAEDPMRAFGAVIGKALRGMPAGQKGLIPILVALQ